MTGLLHSKKQIYHIDLLKLDVEGNELKAL